jgi:monoamine oxidase
VSHSPPFHRMTRTIRVALSCQRNAIPVAEGLDRAARAEERARARMASRREFLADLGRLAAAGAVAGIGGAAARAHARGGPLPSVGIVGAGLAGLTAARELVRQGCAVTLYDANTRVGGRQWSDTTSFAAVGQSCELGGELIDTGHHTMRHYATEFGLDTEVMWGTPEGDTAWYFGGRLHPESEIVDEWRAWVANMKDDLRRLSAAPTADAHNDYDVVIDRMSLAEYLTRPGRSVSPLLYQAIEQSYIAEYGLEIDRQSPLNLVEFMRADNRSKFRPFGVSNEKYRVIGGNDQIAKALYKSVVGLGGRVEPGRSLVRVRQQPTGAIDLTFGRDEGSTVMASFDVAIIAIPFTTLRHVDLGAAGPNAGPLPAWKQKAIDELGYGTNAKQMVQFTGRRWLDAQPPALPRGSNGSSYSDLPNLQATWQTDPALATSSHAVITDYSGGDRGAALDGTALQAAVALFAADFAKVFPGATPATRADGSIIAVQHVWPADPLTQGSYTCYTPGQFTTSRATKGSPSGTCTSPASTPTRSTLGRGSWRAPASPVSTPRPRSSPPSRPVASSRPPPCPGRPRSRAGSCGSRRACPRRSSCRSPAPRCGR